jgi:hypothetical protein
MATELAAVTKELKNLAGEIKKQPKEGDIVKYINAKGEEREAVFVKLLDTVDAQGDAQVQLQSGNAKFAIDEQNLMLEEADMQETAYTKLIALNQDMLDQLSELVSIAQRDLSISEDIQEDADFEDIQALEDQREDSQSTPDQPTEKEKEESGLSKFFKKVEGFLKTLGLVFAGITAALLLFGDAEVFSDILTSIVEMGKKLYDSIKPIIETLMKEVFPVVFDAFMSIFDSLIGLVEPLWEALKPAIDIIVPLIPQFAALFNDIAKLIGLMIEKLTPVLKVVFETLGSVIEAVVKVIGGIVDFISGLLTFDTEKIFGGLADIFSGVGEAISNLFSGTLKTFITFFDAIWGDTIDGISNWFSEMVSNIKEGLNNLFSGIGIPRVELEIPIIGTVGFGPWYPFAGDGQPEEETPETENKVQVSEETNTITTRSGEEWKVGTPERPSELRGAEIPTSPSSFEMSEDKKEEDGRIEPEQLTQPEQPEQQNTSEQLVSTEQNTSEQLVSTEQNTSEENKVESKEDAKTITSQSLTNDIQKMMKFVSPARDLPIVGDKVNEGMASLSRAQGIINNNESTINTIGSIFDGSFEKESSTQMLNAVTKENREMTSSIAAANNLMVAPTTNNTSNTNITNVAAAAMLQAADVMDRSHLSTRAAFTKR